MKLEIVLLLVRHTLTAAGTLLVSRGLFSDADLANASNATGTLLGAIATLYGLGWSAYRKWKRAEDVTLATAGSSVRDHVAAALLLSTVAGCLVGCASLQNPDPATQARMERVTAAATQIGTLYALRQYPEYRPGFAAGVVALDALLRSSNYSRADFERVLMDLPVSEFKGEEGAMYMDGGIVLWELGSSFLWDPNSAPAVAALMRGTRTGIATALAVEPAPATAAGTRSVRPPARAALPFPVRLPNTQLPKRRI